ncbi:MAG TPA: hypothetical protein VK177_07965 [Flavobacteriales bacterium]|nr:hypothetical protein [Flavobacteriales bacterium]
MSLKQGAAQIILNDKCQAFTDQAYFNPEFIKRNKIRSIHGTLSSKRTHDIIRDLGLVQNFEFDTEGRVVKQMYSHHSFGYRTDTTTIIFIYDEKGHLKTKRQNDNFSFYSYNYEYDSAGNVIKETYCRDENCGPSKYDFKLGNQYEIISETFKYISKEGKKIKRYFNNFGKEYQQLESEYNALNYLMDEKMFYTITSRQTMEIKYEYNEQGFCISRIERPVEGPKLIMAYEYDKQGNLLEYDNFVDDEQITHKELIYDKGSMLLNAILSKELRTDIITINKLTYDFY